MRPGSYNVPKKGTTSPRGIEFLETAQNVNKLRDTANERYWANILLSAGKKLSQEYNGFAEEEDKAGSTLVDGDVSKNHDIKERF